MRWNHEACLFTLGLALTLVACLVAGVSGEDQATLENAKVRSVLAVAPNGDASALGDGALFLYHGKDMVLSLAYSDETGWPLLLINYGKTGKRAFIPLNDLVRSKHWVK